MTNPIAQQLKTLPQLSRIRKEDAQRWLSHVVQRDPKRVMWLIGRLGAGFGGSEIGALVLDAMGRTPVFGTAVEQVNEKLMRVLPTPSNHFMRKGVALEQAVEQAVLRLYGGEKDTAVLDAFKNPHPNDPFGLGGNPDFPWVRRDGVRVLVDIKVPGSGEESISDNDKDLHYAIQLNTYNLINEARGLPAFDQLMNIHLELPPVITDAYMRRLEKGGPAEVAPVVEEMVQLLKYERDGMRLHMQEQPINPDVDFNGVKRPLNDIIQEVAATNWQAVLDGNIPELERQVDQALSPEQKQQMTLLEQQLIRLESLNKATTAQVAQVRADIAELTGTINTPGTVSQTPHINIKRSATVNQDNAAAVLQRYGVGLDSVRAERKQLLVRDYDTLAMAEYLKTQGEDMSAFVRPAPLDAAKVMQALEDLGENPARLVEFTTDITNSRKKATKQLVSQLTERFAPAVLSTIETPQGAAADPAQEQPPERDDQAPDEALEAETATLSMTR